jgi:hypothetical protein
MKKLLLLPILCIALLFGGCNDTPRPQSVDTDMLHLAAIMEKEGYVAQYYEEGHSALSAIAEEMQTNTKAPLKGAVKGYLYVQNAQTGACVLEVFVFEETADAKILYDFVNESDRFVENESECRLDATVVYMGYVKDLDLIEGTAVS